MNNRITPKLDYEPRTRSRPAKKPEKFWSPRKWKFYLFLLWLGGTGFWLPVAAERSHMGYVWESYSIYWHYENMLQSGAPHRDHTRQNWKRAEAQLRNADPYIFSFLLTGLLPPLFLLFGGMWLLRNTK